MRRPWPVRRFVIGDTSMQPTLRPGDRVLVWQWTQPRVGDVVVLRDPLERGRFLVKRVASREPTGDLVVRGDNVNVSRDSRHFGAVPRRLVIGSVVYRYLPAESRGRLVASG